MLRFSSFVLICFFVTLSEAHAQPVDTAVARPLRLTHDIGAAAARALGINGGLYPGAVANVNGALHIGDPNAPFQPDGVQLTVRNDAPGGATFVVRGMTRSPGAGAVIGLATLEDDQTGKIVAYNAGNASFNGPRSVFIGTSYGDLGIWGNYSGDATPVNFVTIGGCIRATPGPECNDGTAGYFGVGTVNPPQRFSVVGRTNAEVVAAGIYRADLQYGLLLSTDGASGNSSIVTLGKGATLSLGVDGAAGVTIGDGGVVIGGTLNVVSAYQANGRPGLSGRVLVQDGRGASCSLEFTSGLLTGSTC